MLLYIFGFLGGLALFLYGMQMMSEGLKKAAGHKLSKILENLTKVTILGVLLGAVVTAVLQSSSATTVMTIGFVNAGLLTLKQAFGVIMGANVGTTITAQLIAFKLTAYVPIIVAFGFTIMTLAKRTKNKSLGQVFLGFGLLMLGMSMMGTSVAPLKEFAGFTDFIQNFGHHPVIGILVGMMMTFLIQSSSATIGILIAMASQGLIPLEGAIPVLLGDNIGTCITALLAALRANIAAKRVAVSHVLFNLIGSLIFIVFMNFFVKLVLQVSPQGDIARQIANAHTAFNIINTLIFLPFAGQFVKLVEKIMPSTEEEVNAKPKFLDRNVIGNPSVALTLATREIVGLANLAYANLETVLRTAETGNIKLLKNLAEKEENIDKLEVEISHYLTDVRKTAMSGSMAARHAGLMHACIDIERVGDHAVSIAKRLKSMEEDGIVFSKAARKELTEYYEDVLKTYQMSIESIAKYDRQLAREVMKRVRVARKVKKNIRKNHVQRLNAEECTPNAGFIMVEMLVNVGRVAEHSENLAQIVLGEF